MRQPNDGAAETFDSCNKSNIVCGVKGTDKRIEALENFSGTRRGRSASILDMKLTLFSGFGDEGHWHRHCNTDSTKPQVAAI